MDENNKRFCGMVIPFLIRAGMPDWFTPDLFNKIEVYMPSRLGGLGIPSLIKWEDEPENCMYARAFLAKKYMDVHVRKISTERTMKWERGILFNQIMHNFADKILETRNQREVFDYMTEKMSCSTYTAPVSNRRVMRQVLREQVNIELPTACLGTKETPYGIIYSDEFVSDKIKKVWPRKDIMKTREYLSKFRLDIAILPIELSKDWIPDAGMFVDRKELQAVLGLNFQVPNLGIHIDFFEGNSGRFSPDPF
jgi:hypothetical protein